MTDRARGEGTLVLPPRVTSSAGRIRDAAQRRGLDVVQLRIAEVPDELRGGRAPRYLYAGPTFADAVADALGVVLLETAEDWLATLPPELTRRTIEVMTLAEAHRLRRPAFVKSPNDKSVPARVYPDGTRLPGADAVDPQALVLVSDVVGYRSEFRLHVLDGRVHAASQYARDRELVLGPPTADALAFAVEVLAATRGSLPSAVVVDVGLDLDGGWGVVEANAAWASGSYAADPDAVLDVVCRAAGPAHRLADGDRRFVRGRSAAPRTG